MISVAIIRQVQSSLLVSSRVLTHEEICAVTMTNSLDRHSDNPCFRVEIKSGQRLQSLAHVRRRWNGDASVTHGKHCCSFRLKFIHIPRQLFTQILTIRRSRLKGVTYLISERSLKVRLALKLFQCNFGDPQ